MTGTGAASVQQPSLIKYIYLDMATDWIAAIFSKSNIGVQQRYRDFIQADQNVSLVTVEESYF